MYIMDRSEKTVEEGPKYPSGMFNLWYPLAARHCFDVLKPVFRGLLQCFLTREEKRGLRSPVFRVCTFLAMFHSPSGYPWQNLQENP